jgi:hypothetical protein
MWTWLRFAFFALVLSNGMLVGVLALGVGWYQWLAPKLDRRRAIEALLATSTLESGETRSRAMS